LNTAIAAFSCDFPGGFDCLKELIDRRGGPFFGKIGWEGASIQLNSKIDRHANRDNFCG
jgi:hypothetical protein